MGGSFESGAGDDPDDLFAGNDDADGDENGVEERADVPSPGADTNTGDCSESVDGGGGSEEAESPGVDSALLASEFVPDSYDKSHAWALGRDGVNDGRSEKKTFFLQSSVLDLEAACSREVDEILGGDVPLTDLRELALILAYHQPEALAEAAREWGAESA
jgi:hypothetical protein